MASNKLACKEAIISLSVSYDSRMSKPIEGRSPQGCEVFSELGGNKGFKKIMLIAQWGIIYTQGLGGLNISPRLRPRNIWP